MMIIDGEKYACVSCVRGHRVSNCQHTDRPLQHINRKGRPVSQCDHCRSMRKSRSVHVRCDCGEKPNKCPHLMEYVDGHNQTCCCHHGARCTCSGNIKKEASLDTVPESDSDGDSPQMTKPSKSGSIRRRRANTLDGQRPKKGSGSSGGSSTSSGGSSSATSLSLKPLQSKGSLTGVRSADNLMFALPTDSAAERQRRVRSETASPLLSNRGAGAGLHPHALHLPPLDLSNVDYASSYRGGGASSFDLFGGPLSSSADGPDAPLFSAGLSATPVDWSNYEFAPASSYSTAQSLSGIYDFGGSEQPTLTTATSTSGDASEADDFESSAAAMNAAVSAAAQQHHQHQHQQQQQHHQQHQQQQANFRQQHGSGFLTAAQRAMLASPGPLDYDDLIKIKFKPGAADPTTTSAAHANSTSGLDEPTIAAPVPTSMAPSLGGGFSMVEDAIWTSTMYNDTVVDSPSSLPYEWS